AFHQGERRRRVPLPTYPFERQRYWIDREPESGSGRSAGAPEEEDDAGTRFHLPSWRRSLPPAGPAGRARRWLLLLDGCGLGEELARGLERAGEEVVRLAAGEGDDEPAALLARLRHEDRLP